MKTLKAEDIPAGTSVREFLDSLDVSRSDLLIEQGGQPRVVLISPRALEQRRLAKEKLFQTIDYIRQRNPELEADHVLDELELFD